MKRVERRREGGLEGWSQLQVLSRCGGSGDGGVGDGRGGAVGGGGGHFGTTVSFSSFHFFLPASPLSPSLSLSLPLPGHLAWQREEAQHCPSLPQRRPCTPLGRVAQVNKTHTHTQTHARTHTHTPPPPPTEAVTWLLTRRSCRPAALHYDKHGGSPGLVRHQAGRGVDLRPLKDPLASTLPAIFIIDEPNRHLSHGKHGDSPPSLATKTRLIFHTRMDDLTCPPPTLRPSIPPSRVLVTRYDTWNT